MTIEERLDRLTERHEALTQSVEMLLLEGREQDQRIDKIDVRSDALGAHVQALTNHVNALCSHMERLVGVLGTLANSVATLANIVKVHEERSTAQKDHPKPSPATALTLLEGGKR